MKALATREGSSAFLSSHYLHVAYFNARCITITTAPASPINPINQK
jgi:hypothetical protein